MERELLMEPQTQDPLTDEPVTSQQQTVVVIFIIIICFVCALDTTISLIGWAVRRRGCFISHVENILTFI